MKVVFNPHPDFLSLDVDRIVTFEGVLTNYLGEHNIEITLLDEFDGKQTFPWMVTIEI